jgi:hypothetical protein
MVGQRPDTSDLSQIRMRKHPNLGIKLCQRRCDLHEIELTVGEQAQQRAEAKSLLYGSGHASQAVGAQDNAFRRYMGGNPFCLSKMAALTNKSGQLLPTAPSARSEMLQWLFMQIGSVGPMLG